MFQNDDEISKFAFELNKIIEDTDGEKAKYLIIQVAEDEYAIPVEKIKSISEMKKITKISGSSKYVKGVVNIDEEIVPVCDLQERVGGKEKEASKFAMMIILDTLSGGKKSNIGIIVENIIEVRAISKEDIDEQKGTNLSLGSEYIKSIVKAYGKFILILDVDKLLEN